GVAQSPVDGAGLDLRGEDAGGPVLLEPARSAHGGGGLDSICRGERRPNRPTDHLLVASRTGRGEPARQVPAALPAAMARIAGVAAVTGVRGSGCIPESRIPTGPRSPCRRSGGTWRPPCRPRSRPAPRS